MANESLTSKIYKQLIQLKKKKEAHQKLGRRSK